MDSGIRRVPKPQMKYRIVRRGRCTTLGEPSVGVRIGRCREVGIERAMRKARCLRRGRNRTGIVWTDIQAIPPPEETTWTDKSALGLPP